LQRKKRSPFAKRRVARLGGTRSPLKKLMNATLNILERVANGAPRSDASARQKMHPAGLDGKSQFDAIRDYVRDRRSE
jgi:hypothetical protein